MSAAVLPSTRPAMRSRGSWSLAWMRFTRDRVGVASAVVVAGFLLLTFAAGVGLVARDWQEEVGVSYAPPHFAASAGRTARLEGQSASASGSNGEDLGAVDPIADEMTQALDRRPQSGEELGIVDPLRDELAEIRSRAERSGAGLRADSLWLGADKWGRDVGLKTIKGTQTSLLVGLAAALVAAALGTLFGALAGYYGGRRDELFNWLYSVLTSMPYLLLILAIAAVLGRKGTMTVILILGLTGWTGIFRLVRAEFLKHRVREYVLAADAIGASDAQRMFVHILPNVSHVVLVQLSLHAVLFIKSEVILSFLGFGVGVDTVSWGSMLNEAQTELLLGQWWQFVAPTAAMAVLVTAFSLFTDALHDALDPTLR